MSAQLSERELEEAQGAGQIGSSRLGEYFKIGRTKGRALPDVQPPQIILDKPNASPAGELTVASGTLSLEGRVLDDGGYAYLTVNGTPTALAADTDEIYNVLERVQPEPRRGLFTSAAPGDFVLVARK